MENSIKTHRAGSVMQTILLLHDIMKLNCYDLEIQNELQRTINVLFEKFPDVMPLPSIVKNIPEKLGDINVK